MICTKNGTHTLTSAGTQQTGESVNLTLPDVEVKRLDTCITLQTFCLKDLCIRIISAVGDGVRLDIRHIIQLFTEHLCYQLHAGKICDLIFADQSTVTKYGDLITHLIYLIQEVGNKDDSNTLRAQITHQTKKLFYFLLIQR